MVASIITLLSNFKKKQRWLKIKKFLLDNYNISVHFSSVHHNYFSAWQYVTKTDCEYSQSDGHPDLTNGEPPKTDSASAAIVKGREESDGEGDDVTGKR
jgi:hypothetical protein